MTTQRNRSGGRPTLDEVAALAGVGRGTVSRVVNGSPQVSPAARAAVERAIVKLGYVPNRAARSLVTRRTDSVALVVSESEERVFGEPFFAGIVRGISSSLLETPLQLWLAMAQSPAERERVEHHLTNQHVDGVLLLSLHDADPLPTLLAERDLPVVLGGRPARMMPLHTVSRPGDRRARLAGRTLADTAVSLATLDRSDVAHLAASLAPLDGAGVPWFVDVDNASGARQAAAHLVAAGRRRLASVAGPQDMGVGLARLTGFREACGEAGLPADEDLIAYGDFSEPSGVAAMRQLLARRPDLDAVFVASDLMAAGALRALREAGKRVPEDVAVVGFEDSAVARQTDPPLTTVHQPVEEMGRQMARLLVSRIRGDELTQPYVLLETHLVVRQSA
jgi:DNA-binding LacI/PurR family transcriptional regulator